MRDIKTWLAFGFAGLLIAVCLSIGAAGALLANRAVNQRAALTATADALTRVALLASPTRVSTPTLTAMATTQRTATSIASRWFIEAEQALKRGDPQRVVDLLMPERERLLGKERAQAYYYLGLAECQMAHFQLCAAHLYLRQTLDPSAENLMLLGAAYEAAGQYGSAYETYNKVVGSRCQDADPFRDKAQSRMDEVDRLCCNKLASPTPGPRAKTTSTPFQPTITPLPPPYRQTPTIIDPTNGNAHVTLEPGQRQLFRFMLPNIPGCPTLRSLTFYLISTQAQGPTTLELALWRQGNETWEMVSLNWGQNPIGTWDLFVSRQWEVFAELYNPDTKTYVVDKLGFTMGVLHQDGKQTVHGLKLP